MQIKEFSSQLGTYVPERVKQTLKLRALGLLKIPVLFFLSPSVVEMNDYRCVVKIPLSRRAKNHLGSMYFAAMAAGADCAAGIMAWKMAEEAGSKKKGGKRINLIFKEFKAEFLKRAEGDVLFTCEDGQEIRALVEKVALTGERHQIPVFVTATVPKKLGKEPVAKFELVLSMK